MFLTKRLLSLFFSVLILSAGIAPAYGQIDVLSSINERIERFQARYGIPFKYDGFPPGKYYIKFLEVTPEEYRALLKASE